MLRLRGELDVDTESVLRRPLLEAVATQGTVVLDAMGVTFVDFHGLRLLLSALRESGRHGGRLVIACENPTVLRLFALTEMDRTFRIVRTGRRPSPVEADRAWRTARVGLAAGYATVRSLRVLGAPRRAEGTVPKTWSQRGELTP